MKTILITIIFTLLLIQSLTAQDVKTTVDQTNKYKALNRVIKKDGWNIPILQEKDSYAPKTSLIENYPVTIQSYKLKKPTNLLLEYYSLRISDDSLLTFSKKIEVGGFSAFIADGKTFAYRFNGVVFGYTEEGNKIYAGAILSAYYVDEDGDGKFETCYLNQLADKPPDKIPNWIIKDKNKIIKPIAKPPLVKPVP